MLSKVDSTTHTINNKNNNDNEIYTAPATMCTRRLEESRKKMKVQKRS